MKSLDTNILLYALNRDCSEHGACRELVERAVKERELWVIADQVWFELYRLLRNPSVLLKPLGAEDAASAVAWYREKTGWLQCAWEPSMMKNLAPFWKQNSFAPRNTFDTILAVTLKAHGVEKFYTRNTRDFEYMGFFEVINPVPAAGA